MRIHTIPLIEEYEINPNTMIIKPIPYGGKIYSEIWELDNEVISPFKPLSIIKKGCKNFGSSYEGRREGTKQLTGFTHKTPITIDPTNFMYFFPTTSAINSVCIWISHEHIHSHERTDGGYTKVTFINKRTDIIPVSHSSFINQILRTALLKTRLMKKIEESERKALYFIEQRRTFQASERPGKYR